MKAFKTFNFEHNGTRVATSCKDSPVDSDMHLYVRRKHYRQLHEHSKGHFLPSPAAAPARAMLHGRSAIPGTRCGTRRRGEICIDPVQRLRNAGTSGHCQGIWKKHSSALNSHCFCLSRFDCRFLARPNFPGALRALSRLAWNPGIAITKSYWCGITVWRLHCHGSVASNGCFAAERVQMPGRIDGGASVCLEKNCLFVSEAPSLCTKVLRSSAQQRLASETAGSLNLRPSKMSDLQSRPVLYLVLPTFDGGGAAHREETEEILCITRASNFAQPAEAETCTFIKSYSCWS